MHGPISCVCPEVTYERYCYFTCKPIIPNALSTNVPCERLTADEIKLQVRGGLGLRAPAYSSGTHCLRVSKSYRKYSTTATKKNTEVLLNIPQDFEDALHKVCSMCSN